MTTDSVNIEDLEGLPEKDAKPAPGLLQHYRLPFIIFILILIAAYTAFLIVQSYLTWSKSMDAKS